MNRYLPDAGSFKLQAMGMKHYTALILGRASAFIGG
jgi:hypothetical protein